MRWFNKSCKIREENQISQVKNNVLIRRKITIRTHFLNSFQDILLFVNEIVKNLRY